MSSSATPWDWRASLSVGFSRQEYWSGLPFSTPGHLPDPGIEPASSVAPAFVRRFFMTEPPGKPPPSGNSEPYWRDIKGKWMLEKQPRITYLLRNFLLQGYLPMPCCCHPVKSAQLSFPSFLVSPVHHVFISSHSSSVANCVFRMLWYYAG